LPRSRRRGDGVRGVTGGFHAWLATTEAGDSIYAVGAFGSFDPVTNAESDHTLSEHWDGANWSLVMSISNGSSDALVAIAAISPGDIWAAGWINSPTCPPGRGL